MDYNNGQPDALPSHHGLSATRRFAHAIASRLARRRLALILVSRFANRRFVFAATAVSVFGAKGVHIYTHLSALPTIHLVRWGYSFFAQDVVLLLIVRLLLDPGLLTAVNALRLAVTTVVSVIITYLIALGAITVSFFVVSGSEIHWRNIALVGDTSSWLMLLSGLASFALVLCIFVLFASITQDLCYVTAGLAADVVKWPLTFVFRKLVILRCLVPGTQYAQIPQREVEFAVKGDFEEDGVDSEAPPASSVWSRLLYLFISTALLTQLVLFLVRPNESALNFMSWTPALLPFVDFSYSSPNLDRLMPLSGFNIGRTWDNLTALDDPIHLPWLPANLTPPGFEDWHNAKKHYNAAADPLRISNLEDDLLPMLRDKLKDVPIRHIMLIILESTRKDVFPIKKDSLIWQRLTDSFRNKSLPNEVQAKLATLTSTANFFTGDYHDGFEHQTKKRRGGINFNKVFTTATYTLKSIVGTMCGITPLVADFNREYHHHIYQPCLPQIFEAFNMLDHSQDDSQDHFTSYKWRSSFLQSVTRNYDKYVPLLSSMGITPENLISKEYLRGHTAKFGAVDLPDINYFGMSEIAVEDYIRDAFVSAKKNDERVFLTHLTSTSHHPFAMPTEETYTSLSNGLNDLSHYLNAIGYDDRWLGRISDILDQEGVANETLLVMVGDHGISIPENGIVSPYYNPNVGTLHVPLILSHPNLPAIDVDDAVISLQILPTILDLLLETSSLSKTESLAARDLVRNYEGQSLARPIRKSSNETGQANWQYTVINPGRAMLGVRDARQPDWHLVVPIIDNIEWRFTDMSSDPIEEHPVFEFDFVSFLDKVQQKHGMEAAKWAEEGAFVARWWVEENAKRWRYGPYTD